MTLVFFLVDDVLLGSAELTDAGLRVLQLQFKL